MQTAVTTNDFTNN